MSQNITYQLEAKANMQKALLGRAQVFLITLRSLLEGMGQPNKELTSLIEDIAREMKIR